MPDLPWFPFYPADWLLSPTVRQMPYDVRGAFVELLCYQWREGGLPIGVEEIEALTGVPGRLVKKCLPHFPKANAHRRSNAKLAKVRTEQKSKRAKRVMAGRKGAEARWQTHIDRNAEPLATEQSRTEQNRGLPSAVQNAALYVCCGRQWKAAEYFAHLDREHEGQEPEKRKQA